MKENIQVADPNIGQQCEVFSRCDVLLINKKGGIGDILCTRLLFEDLKQISHIGQVAFAVPRKHLPLIDDHPFIDRKLAVEDLTAETYEDYIFVKDMTYTPDNLEYRTRPHITRNRSDIFANSIGLTLRHHAGHLTFTDKEMEFARRFINYFGNRQKIGIAPFTSHVSKDLPTQLINDLVSWCRHKRIVPLIFHDEGIGIKDAIVVNHLTLREWMAVISLLDVVVTASTAMFWIAQLTNRPTIVITGFEDAQVFGKYHSNLVIIQRRARNKRKLYSTIIDKKKEIEKFRGDWSYCPCWDARKCAFKTWGEYPLFCLESIRIDEVTKPLDNMLSHSPSIIDTQDRNSRVAFVREGGLGDILMTIPVIKALNKLGKEIDYFTMPEYFLLLKNVNCRVKAIKNFDKKRYDKVYDLRNELESYRVALNQQHRIDAIAEFCKVKINDYSIPLSDTESHWAKQWLQNQGYGSETLIGICVRSAFRLRSWIETGPRDVVDLLPSDMNYIVFGSNDWYDWKHPRVHLAINFTLEQVIALIKRCTAVITTDNGLLHVAGALEIPIVALFGSLPPEWRTKYYKSVKTIVPENLSCYPCREWQVGKEEDIAYCRNVDTRCMRMIKPQMVANTLKELLKEI